MPSGSPARTLAPPIRPKWELLLLLSQIQGSLPEFVAPNDRMSIERRLRRGRTRQCSIRSHRVPAGAPANTNSRPESDQVCQVYPQLDSLEENAMHTDYQGWQVWIQRTLTERR